MIVRIDETTILNISKVLSLLIKNQSSEEKVIPRIFSSDVVIPAETKYVVTLEYIQADQGKYTFTRTTNNFNEAKVFAKNLADILCKLDDSIMTAELERAISE